MPSVAEVADLHREVARLRAELENQTARANAAERMHDLARASVLVLTEQVAKQGAEVGRLREHTETLAEQCSYLESDAALVEAQRRAERAEAERDAWRSIMPTAPDPETGAEWARDRIETIRNLSRAYGEQKARAERAEAEVARLRDTKRRSMQMSRLWDAEERAERAEAALAEARNTTGAAADESDDARG